MVPNPEKRFPVEPAPGPLQSRAEGDAAGGDTLSLHTLKACAAFMGRRADPQAGRSRSIGARHFAAVMRVLWILSAADNPYADWILVQVDQALAKTREQLQKVSAQREAHIARLRERGLSFSVLGSRTPATFTLDFVSPYGYAAAHAVLDFDWQVRLVRSLVQRDQLADIEGRRAVQHEMRLLRGCFEKPVSWAQLASPPFAGLSRRDFLPGADDAARARVLAAFTRFGELPREVFTGETAPRHSRRTQRPDEREMQMLRTLPLVPDALPGQVRGPHVSLEVAADAALVAAADPDESRDPTLTGAGLL
jgi:integrating conjugative element protein (TIGR03761 family)